MSPSALGQLRTLFGEAVFDALRRRIVVAITVLSLLSLMVVESCTSCAAGGDLTVSGERVDVASLLSITGVVLYGVLALWTLVLAALLGADHLTEPISDGSAHLALARPVSREVFALARLLGSLAISLAAGVLLLGGATFFLVARYGLDPAPAVQAGALTALAAVSVAALAMTASLFVPRFVVFALALLWIALTSGANLASLAGAEPGGALGALDRFGTPFVSALALALAPWSGRPPAASGPELVARLALWALFAVVLLAVAFRRREL